MNKWKDIFAMAIGYAIIRMFGKLFHRKGTKPQENQQVR